MNRKIENVTNALSELHGALEEKGHTRRAEHIEMIGRRIRSWRNKDENREGPE